MKSYSGMFDYTAEAVGQTLEVPLAGVSLCMSHCLEVQVDDAFMFIQDTGVCHCFLMPVILNLEDAATSSATSGSRLFVKGPDCSKSLINHPDYYIDNSFITHSVSPVNSLCQPYYLRHMYDEGKEDHGICFPADTVDPFVQIRFQSTRTVVGVKTRGRRGPSGRLQYFATYNVQYYASAQWHTVAEDNEDIIFTGNDGTDNVVYNALPSPVQTAKIKIYPLSGGSGSYFSAQIDIIGCD